MLDLVIKRLLQHCWIRRLFCFCSSLVSVLLFFYTFKNGVLLIAKTTVKFFVCVY